MLTEWLWWHAVNMNSKVQEFLIDSGGHNFTESAPRPPVPGEENELQSNGGISTKSSGSHKSIKSHSSGKSAGSHKGEVACSPAATPRRSNLDKSLSGNFATPQNCKKTDEDAPLGFEPEGSDANSSPFTENDTPPYLNWAKSLNHLLDDRHGVELFKEFLSEEGYGTNAVLFWFACQGLKALEYPAEEKKIQHVIKVINKKFIKGKGTESLRLISKTKKEVNEKLAKNIVEDQNIFDVAQKEVEEYMRSGSYLLFLKSDRYLQYCQYQGKSPKSSETSSGSNSVRPLSGPLPTLLEDQELSTKALENSLDLSSSFNDSASGKHMVAPSCHRIDRSSRRTEMFTGASPYPSRNTSFYPMHTSYAPVSAQDSEIQSLSSDALTDDTVSITDGSIDGFPTHPKAWKQHRRKMQRQAQVNKEGRDNTLQPFIIPRTLERAPKDRNIAEVDPAKFAALLVERLEKVHAEQEHDEKMKVSLRACEPEVEEEPRPTLPVLPVVSKKPSAAATLITQLMQPSLIPEKDAQSILEEHCSRVWASTHHTPNLCHSPKSKSPDRVLRKPPLPGVGINTSFPVGVVSARPGVAGHHKIAKKEKEHQSVLSFDSGMGGDEKRSNHHDVELHHKHIHHYHHHHHHHSSREKSSRFLIEHEAQQRSMTCYVGDVSRHPEEPSAKISELVDGTRGRTMHRKTNARKISDSSNNLDSGISMIGDKDLPVPNPTDPKYAEIMQWMVMSDKVDGSVPTAAGQSADSEKSCSHKRSHKSSTSASQMQHKQSNSLTKKQGSSSSNNNNNSIGVPCRSTSLDRSGINTLVAAVWAQPSGSGTSAGGVGASDTSIVLPSQPFVQDPSMPLLNPPNTTTQLEEAKRRLETEARQVPAKSKSFAGVPCKDKRSGTIFQSASQIRPLPQTRTVPNALDLSIKHDTNKSTLNTSVSGIPAMSQSMIEKKPGRKCTVPPTSLMSTSVNMPPSSSQETVIGYYFCGDPIPFVHNVPYSQVTLADFKQIIGRRGNLRFYFKKISNDFGSGVVYEEINEDVITLPLYEGKIVARVERVD